MPLGRPSRAAPFSLSPFLSLSLSLSLRDIDIPRARHSNETRTIPGATKITRSSRFRMIRPRLVATAISRRNPSLRNAVLGVPLTLRVPLCERPTRRHKGYRRVTPWLKSLSCEVHLPAKPVGEAYSVRSILLFVNPQHWHGVLRAFAFFANTILKHLKSLNHRILRVHKWSITYWICISFLNFSIV